MDLDRRPQAGLELSLDRDLKRLEKTSVIRRGADGTPLPIGVQRGVFDEDQLNLQLTLDVRLQEDQFLVFHQCLGALTIANKYSHSIYS